jgi:hypothetical protein
VAIDLLPRGHLAAEQPDTPADQVISELDLAVLTLALVDRLKLPNEATILPVRNIIGVPPVRVGGFMANLFLHPARAAKSLAEPQSSQSKVLCWPSPLRLGGSARKFFSCGELCQGLAARSPG